MNELKEETRTKQLGKVTPSLNDKLNNYCDLIGVPKIQLLEELINKELEKSILTNEYIDIEGVYYFNFPELLKNKEVKAVKDKPKTDLNKLAIVKMIPNNLDVFDKDKRTFCYNGIAEKHLGVYTYNRIVINKLKVNETQFFQYYILFEYDSKTEELVLKLTNHENIFLLFDISDAKEIISDLADINKEYKEAEDNVKNLPDNATIKDLFTTSETEGLNLGLYLFSIDVIQSYAEAKGFSWSVLKWNPELYERLKGTDNSEDLALIKNVEIIPSKEKDKFTLAIPTYNDEASDND